MDRLWDGRGVAWTTKGELQDGSGETGVLDRVREGTGQEGSATVASAEVKPSAQSEPGTRARTPVACWRRRARQDSANLLGTAKVLSTVD